MNNERPNWGCDPELHLFDVDFNRIVSAIDVLKCDKHNPIDLGDGIKCYADNVLIEASMPPSDTIAGIVRTVGESLRRMQSLLGKRYRLVAKASHVYDDRDMQDPKAKEAGCSQNFDAYTGEANLPPRFDGNMRTGSFHIHMGWSYLSTPERRVEMIKHLDRCLGLASVVFDVDESAGRRRQLYGKAGEFRPTPYGVEYRVLGNYVIRSPELLTLAYEIAEYATQVMQGNAGMRFQPRVTKQVRDAINTNNYQEAHALLHNFLTDFLTQAASKPRSVDLYRDWKIKI